MTALKRFLRAIPRDQRDRVAARVGTSWTYLRYISYGAKACSPRLAINLERESGGDLRVEDLVPNLDWQVIRGRCAGCRRAA